MAKVRATILLRTYLQDLLHQHQHQGGGVDLGQHTLTISRISYPLAAHIHIHNHFHRTSPPSPYSPPARLKHPATTPALPGMLHSNLWHLLSQGPRAAGSGDAANCGVDARRELCLCRSRDALERGRPARLWQIANYSCTTTGPALHPRACPAARLG